jgi:hypothetical protein
MLYHISLIISSYKLMQLRKIRYFVFTSVFCYDKARTEHQQKIGQTDVHMWLHVSSLILPDCMFNAYPYPILGVIFPFAWKAPPSKRLFFLPHMMDFRFLCFYCSIDFIFLFTIGHNTLKNSNEILSLFLCSFVADLFSFLCVLGMNTEDEC